MSKLTDFTRYPIRQLVFLYQQWHKNMGCYIRCLAKSINFDIEKFKEIGTSSSVCNIKILS